VRSATARFLAIAGILALALICLTVLASLQVVPGDRVLDILATAIPAFVAAWLGTKTNGHDGRSLRPPPTPAPYPDGRP